MLRHIALFLQILQRKQNLLILSADRQAIKFITMKKIFFFTAITLLMLSSCRKEGATLVKDQTLAQSQTQTNASSGQAFPFNYIYKIDYDGQQGYNSCTNELATVYGNDQLIIHGIYNGTKSTITVNSHTQGTITAVGESGRQYTIEGALLYQESNFSNGVFTTKLVRNLRWITEGRGNNLTISETFYIKVDADGNVTVIRDPVSERYCQ